jgi:hypothetical protein
MGIYDDNSVGYQPGGDSDNSGNPVDANGVPVNSAGVPLSSLAAVPTAPQTPTAPTTASGSGVPGSSSTIGYNGNTGPYGAQAPNSLGQGTFQSNPYAINDAAITGSNNGYYGQAGITQNLQNMYNGNQPLNVQATAPTVQAASGQGAQGNASSYQAALSSAANYQAALANAASYAAQNMGATGYTGAHGQAASANAASGQAALANGYSLTSPAAMLAAQQGYATTGQTGLSTAGDAAWQAQQAQLANTLQTQASGGGMSPADLQLQAGLEGTTENQLAVRGSQMGGSTNTALAMRSAADQAAAANANTNFSAAQLRAQETLNAQNSLGSVLGTARGQSQAYNATAAGLAQQANLANAGYANTALANNAQLAQAANLNNAQFAQTSALGNQTAGNAMQQFNVGQQNTMLGQNMSLAEQTNLQNAANAQAMSQANMASSNAADQYTAGNIQAAAVANQAAQNAAAQYNATNAENTNLYNAGALNTAGQYNAGLQEQTALANQTSLNTAGQYNAGNAQAMTLANMSSQNQFAAANEANQQAANLANQSMAGQYGVQNAANALAANQQYQNFGIAALGAQTGIAQNEASAALANQQLQVQQQNAINQINQQAYQSSAAQNANLSGAVASGIAGTLGTVGTQIGNQSNQPTPATGPGVASDGTYTGPNSATGSGYVGTETGSGFSTPVENVSDEIPLQQQLNNFKFPSASDENLKTGIQGGNPMMQSFLSQLHESQDDPTNINVNEGVGFKDPTYQIQKTTTGGGSQSAAQSTTFGAVDTVASAVNPLFGAALGALFGLASNGGAGDNPVSTQTREVETSGGSGYTEGNVPSETELESPSPYTSQSDDQAKTAIQSGNQGIQAFLQSQGAQQQANASLGTQNNAFDQIAGPAPTVADRPMPNPNAGYGSLSSNTSQGYYGQNSSGGYYDAGYTGAGGMTSGGYQGGTWQGGGWAPGSVEGSGASGQAGYQGGGYQSGGYGSASAGGGGYQSGGLGQQAGMTGAGGFASPQNQFFSSAADAPVASPFANTPALGWQQQSAPNLNQNYQSAIGQINAATAPPAPAFQPAQTQPGFTANSGALSAIGLGGLGTFGLTPVGYGLGTLSDEEAKEQTRGTPKEDRDPSTVPDRGMAERDPSEMQSFLDSIHAHQYRYKDPDAPGAGHGTYVSPMAQEIEKTPLGKPAVSTGADGYKRVDYGKLLGTMLAGEAYLHERTSALEEMMRARHG